MNTEAVKLKEPDTEIVKQLNDTFRRNPFVEQLGLLTFTPAVAALSDENSFALIGIMQEFEDFNEDNDPYGEHDFGRLNFRGESYFLKIDYYDKGLKFHSPDKSNPALTTRVLTLMRVDEY